VREPRGRRRKRSACGLIFFFFAAAAAAAATASARVPCHDDQHRPACPLGVDSRHLAVDDVHKI
jgi:hypothetical protein